MASWPVCSPASEVHPKSSECIKMLSVSESFTLLVEQSGFASFLNEDNVCYQIHDSISWFFIRAFCLGSVSTLFWGDRPNICTRKKKSQQDFMEPNRVQACCIL